MVGGDVHLFIERRKLELGGSHFVVTGLGGNAETVQRVFKVFHEGHDAGGNGAEIVVFHFLTLGGGGAVQGAAGHDEVGTLGGKGLVHEEVFLFRADLSVDMGGAGVAEQTQNAQRLTGHGGSGTQQRNLAVKRFARVGIEHGGNVQRVTDEEDRRGGVPGGVAAGLEGGTQAAGREAGSVGLAGEQGFSREGADHLAVNGLEEGVVLFRGEPGEGMEPVSVMSGAAGNGPVLHGVGHGAGDGGIEAGAVEDGLFEVHIHVVGQMPAHGVESEHVTAEIFVVMPLRGGT